MSKKYRIMEEIDANGTPFNYIVQKKFLFWWIEISETPYLNNAQNKIARLLSTKVEISRYE